eukprot:NODE_1491_length_1512_cov_39.417635_g1347_i0.p1 GENE.NODE_1491_length_1512_cov_39.417635_g1347_i0~~NODE_1491_length_1512_cov_39.417635_g1347_i0.p1  ORF type:complete len:414 (+),score=71.57 NODE_1491_length_1512_cov_39.417635_g1347_i0:81-1322(+)
MERSPAAARWARTGHTILFTKRLERMASLRQEEFALLEPSVSKHRVEPVATQLWEILSGSSLNLLLPCVPLSFVCYYLSLSASLTFGLSFLSLIPLAAMLGTFTEDLALRSSETMGAFLNATFGNATELIISIFALRSGMNEVIKNSLIGSVLGNMMLVLGCAFLAGGWQGGEVIFNTHAANVYCSLLLAAAFGLIVPTVFAQLPGSTSDMTLALSREVAGVMCIGYILYLFFQMYTHKKMFEDDLDVEECSPEFSASVATIGLASATILIAFESEFLVANLEPAALACGLSSAFVGVILVPIVGNAAEHATAVVMAYRGKMGIALGVAIGSSIQIALFVVPLLVLISACMGGTLDLNFHPFGAVVTFVSILLTNSLVFNGRCHWLDGALLLLSYVMVAIALLHFPESAGRNY